MSNGKQGDHPLSDILIHKVLVFSSDIDSLIVEIAKFVPIYRLREMFNWYSPPPFNEFEKQLKIVLERVVKEAKDKGWDLNNPDE
jgi:hypothetical protein